MAEIRCRACGAVYSNFQPKCPVYFHECAPQTVVTVTLDSGQTAIRALPDYAGITIVKDARAKQELVAAGADPATIAIEQRRTRRRRPNHRNEHTLTRTGPNGQTRVMYNEGAGTEPAPDRPPDPES